MMLDIPIYSQGAGEYFVLVRVCRGEVGRLDSLPGYEHTPMGLQKEPRAQECKYTQSLREPAVEQTSSNCRTAKKYFFSQSSKLHSRRC